MSANKTLFPKLHINNIIQVRSALKHPGFKEGIWFHGDGNIYVSEKESTDRVDFHNPHPANDAAKYRVHLTRTDAIPASVDEMADLLVANYQKEMIARAETETSQVDTSLGFKMDSEDELQPGPGARPLVTAPIQKAPAAPVAPIPAKPVAPIPAKPVAPVEVPADPVGPDAQPKGIAAPADPVNVNNEDGAADVAKPAGKGKK